MKVFKRPRKPTAEKSKSENPRRKRPIVGKYGIQSTNEMAFKRPATLRASFRFPAIRFDASTLLLFSGFTHAHAKCPPVGKSLCENYFSNQMQCHTASYFILSLSMYSVRIEINDACYFVAILYGLKYRS